MPDHNAWMGGWVGGSHGHVEGGMGAQMDKANVVASA